MLKFNLKASLSSITFFFIFFNAELKKAIDGKNRKKIEAFKKHYATFTVIVKNKRNFIFFSKFTHSEFS